MSSSATEPEEGAIVLAERALSALLHDGEIVALRREPEAVELVLRPGIGDAGDDGLLLHGRFTGLRECNVQRPALPADPPPMDETARAAWWARVSRVSTDWMRFEAAIGTPERWYEVMDASIRGTQGPVVELELYGPLAVRHADGRRNWDGDEWHWVTVRAASVTWTRRDGTPLDLDVATALAIVWWDAWAAEPPRTMTAAEAAAAGPLKPGTRIVDFPPDRDTG